ncbi:hypothetical protein GII30_00110 [Gordonia amarae]|uniref:Uncharacterized protein n=2 Tax=Gordonia amarae TaxID=36821 RepID=G7GQ82_9ACTN|nr:hypothetical protein [Gordonia amarae]MCS3876739.1 hypothetical protein [Gordonia amarae]QHN15592.1 hypothetical protein GII35_00110 [Gordonia amarae]QHN20162.1 hypothetical protein GII34_00110 [Gordonia amarae]QHN29012.1 hypothetical protein GII32_00110 [Gordonia amarae]QHN37793.1 hypothetical protein GII30_00110 [Gordonia amarae]
MTSTPGSTRQEPVVPGATNFEISADDMTTLRALSAVDYGDATVFPVYSGR